MSEHTIHPPLQYSAFLHLLEAEPFVLVTFSRLGCTASAIMRERVAPLAQAGPHPVPVVHLDVETHAVIATHFEVSRTPALLLFQGQDLVWQQVGMTDFSCVRFILDTYTSVPQP